MWKIRKDPTSLMQDENHHQLRKSKSLSGLKVALMLIIGCDANTYIPYIRSTYTNNFMVANNLFILNL